jgi:DNA-binding NarL/FixJ family response regulator
MGATQPPSARRVLVADDDPQFLRLACTILGRTGYACERVENGHLAVECLRAENYDVLVADVHMPGNELLELLETGRAVGVPIVIVTGDPSIESAVASLRGGAIDYVIKPFEPRELVSAVSKAMERTGLKNEVTRSLALLNQVVHSVLGGDANDGASLPQAAPMRIETSAFEKLSNRERDVARMFADAKLPTEIARTLGLSENTVRNHLKAIYRKLGVHSQLELFVKLSGGRQV